MRVSNNKVPLLSPHYTLETRLPTEGLGNIMSNPIREHQETVQFKVLEGEERSEIIDIAIKEVGERITDQITTDARETLARTLALINNEAQGEVSKVATDVQRQFALQQEAINTEMLSFLSDTRARIAEQQQATESETSRFVAEVRQRIDEQQGIMSSELANFLVDTKNQVSSIRNDIGGQAREHLNNLMEEIRAIATQRVNEVVALIREEERAAAVQRNEAAIEAEEVAREMRDRDFREKDAQLIESHQKLIPAAMPMPGNIAEVLKERIDHTRDVQQEIINMVQKWTQESLTRQSAFFTNGPFSELVKHQQDFVREYFAMGSRVLLSMIPNVHNK
jgi:hypothetical protein